MTTLVTGATGFVGSAVVRRLLEAGHRVRVVVRPTSDRENLAGLDLDVREADLGRPETLAAAVEGCTALMHVAADYRFWVPDPEAMMRVNVEGTRALLGAAHAAGVRRIVYTSSVAVLAASRTRSVADEATPVALADMIGHYKRSKFLAEQAVHDLVREGVPVVIVNPSTPVGPGDVKPTPTGRMIRDATAGRIPAYVETGLNVVHVDDVAEGHLRALEHGRVGERYILGGEDMTLLDVLTTIAGLTGGRPPRVRLPHGAVLPFAFAAEGWARLTGTAPFATVDELRMARKFMYFSADKARRELGYRPRPAREALADAVAWFRARRARPRGVSPGLP